MLKCIVTTFLVGQKRVTLLLIWHRLSLIDENFPNVLFPPTLGSSIPEPLHHTFKKGLNLT